MVSEKKIIDLELAVAKIQTREEWFISRVNELEKKESAQEERIESLEQIIHDARKLSGYVFATALAVVSIFGAIGACWPKVKQVVISAAEYVK